MKSIFRLYCWLAGHRFTIRFISKVCSWDADAGVTEGSTRSGYECSRCGLEKRDE